MSKNSIYIYFIGLFLLINAKDSYGQEIVLRDSKEIINVIINSNIYTSDSDISIHNFKQNKKFLPIKTSINNGKTNWFLFTVDNKLEKNTIYYIRSNFLDSLTLYNFSTKEIIGVTGNRYSYNALSRKEETGYIKLELAKNEKLNFALKLNGNFPNYAIKIDLIPGNEISKSDDIINKQNFALLAIILSFLIFNTLVYITLKDNSYLYYIFYLFNLFMFLGVRSLVKGLNLEIETYVLHYVIVDIFLILFNIAVVKFALSYFEDFINVKWKNFLNGYLYVFIVPLILMIIYYKNYYQEPQNYVLALLSICTALAVLVFTLNHIKFNKRVAMLFLLAELPMILGGMFLASEFLINDAEHSLRHGPSVFKISVVLEILFFSFALGNKYREQRLLLLEQLELNEQLKIQKLEELKVLSDQKNRQLGALVEQRTLELKKTNSDLLKLNKEKNKIFSILGHDLRSPLSSLIMMLELFNSADLSEEELKEMVTITKTQLISLNGSVENLFSWAQSQMEGLTVNPKSINLSELISEKTNLLKITADKKKILLNNQIDENVNVFIDRNHLGIIIQNLINNAIKFTKENGLIKIEVTYNAQKAFISVIDTGIGMKPELIERINNDLLVSSTKGTAGEKGTGLGLLLCKELIEKNNGAISFKSVSNQGTTITLTVPIFQNNAI
jgi:signal transduction histidine kinase